MDYTELRTRAIGLGGGLNLTCDPERLDEVRLTFQGLRSGYYRGWKSGLEGLDMVSHRHETSESLLAGRWPSLFEARVAFEHFGWTISPIARVIRHCVGSRKAHWFRSADDAAPLEFEPAFCCVGICGTITVMSTRLFSFLPLSVELGATGSDSPYPML